MTINYKGIKMRQKQTYKQYSKEYKEEAVSLGINQ